MTTRIPFTESQWEELENQALVFKYLAANIPLGGMCTRWAGMERKIDAEPGRCRRTDGKKWRCSKDASPDSKYCERHMHRGKNRSSRKPLPPPPQFSVPSTPSIFLDFSLASSRAKSKRTGYMNDFFSIEPSGSIKSCSGLAMEEDGGSSKYESLKQREKQPDRSCFILGTELGTLERPLMLEAKQKQRDDKDYEEEEQRKPLKLTILGGSLLFEIQGAWRRLLCAKQVISLVKTMKSVFFPDMFVRRLPCKSSGSRRLTQKSFGQCRD
ncbi:hypothetical protein YC2023_082271 [Brassica napus]